jgi:DMSO/TMAO reductase YedYZ molybdopterin-dependent catalytic subunit
MKIVVYKWPPVLMAMTLVSVLLLGCMGDRQSQDTKSVEVREYQGQKLDPMAKFEENSIQGPPRLDIHRYALKVSGLVEKPLSYSYQEVLARTPVSKVTVIHCVEGWDVKILWEGVPIPELLRAAGVKPTAKTVIFKSADGYSTSLPLETVIKKNILLAYRMNGLTLPEERGFPFQVVAEDKWGYKWAKWVTEMELSDNPNFKGYWESRGYNAQGDLSGPIFEERR